MQAHSLMVFKKTLVIASLLFGIIYFRYALYALFSVEVAGIRYFSLFVSGDVINNGWSQILYERPYFKILDNDKAVWRICQKLNKNVLGGIKSSSDWSEIGPYEVVSESYSNGYVAYIKTKNRLLFINGFPDFGGASPSEEEKNICAK